MKMVYKCPGNDKKPDHIKFKGEVMDYKAVNKLEVEGCIKDGWFESPIEAYEYMNKPKYEEIELTRTEIMDRLTDAGIQFSKRASKAELEALLNGLD